MLKTYKTFLATYPVVGGRIRVVLVRETDGWVAYFCTDPNATVAQILEAVTDRATIDCGLGTSPRANCVTVAPVPGTTPTVGLHTRIAVNRCVACASSKKLKPLTPDPQSEGNSDPCSGGWCAWSPSGPGTK